MVDFLKAWRWWPCLIVTVPVAFIVSGAQIHRLKPTEWLGVVPGAVDFLKAWRGWWPFLIVTMAAAILGAHAHGFEPNAWCHLVEYSARRKLFPIDHMAEAGRVTFVVGHVEMTNIGARKARRSLKVYRRTIITVDFFVGAMALLVEPAGARPMKGI